eukprot:CAMPEP_0201474846 /NCGR_PEP_ID=MMETSP0151_2-20130828/304_1 /ASSEMBLY_ACC=CAM_ASM_000257 /TAXON_ID=200890 /ORGANISM="Paramoeba atlantica, Strain 621/1 / CCAP 1560/9" /LENGTH=283 /DNA_ID=CAMNT_0047854757 /DNA_START=57 /DNA_END=908 /DNA_ORIENTATION=+
MLTLLFVTSLLFGSALSQTFEGEWTDSPASEGYGISTFVCVDGANFYGFYSQVGVMRATISGNTATGSWYEPGVEKRKYEGEYYGPFEITIATDGNSWTGIWSYANGTDGGTWDETRINPTTTDSVTALQCWWPGDDTVPGTWNQFPVPTIFWICEDNKRNFHGSQIFDVNNLLARGSSEGVEFPDSGLLSGITELLLNDGSVGDGQIMYGTLNDGTLIANWWQNLDDVLNTVNDPNTHVLQILNPDSPASDKECALYNDSASSSLIPSTLALLSGFLLYIAM